MARQVLIDPSKKKAHGRPRKNPPKNAAELILQYASEGYSKLAIGHRIGASFEVFQRWIEENPELKQALDEGREREHKELFNSLYTQAKNGNVTAAIFLLKARHGYREGDQSEIANRVSINFQLPGALPLDQFRVIDHEPNRTEPLPAKTTLDPRRA